MQFRQGAPGTLAESAHRQFRNGKTLLPDLLLRHGQFFENLFGLTQFLHRPHEQQPIPRIDTIVGPRIILHLAGTTDGQDRHPRRRAQGNRPHLLPGEGGPGTQPHLLEGHRPVDMRRQGAHGMTEGIRGLLGGIAEGPEHHLRAGLLVQSRLLLIDSRQGYLALIAARLENA